MLLSCREDGDTISHKKVSDSSQLDPRVVNLHLLCISWAGLSLGASQCWVSVRAEDVSLVSSRPISFPLTNITAVPPATEQIKTQCVCVCTFLSDKWFYTAWTSVSAVPALAFVSMCICVCQCDVCVNLHLHWFLWTGMCVFSCISVYLYVCIPCSDHHICVRATIYMCVHPCVSVWQFVCVRMCVCVSLSVSRSWTRGLNVWVCIFCLTGGTTWHGCGERAEV